ncbi:MAG TPA: hypothetical protein VGO66_04385 [Solirubrobacterales bacterium]|nr:hypothetical protein [Solirubrobacterales bacterium]
MAQTLKTASADEAAAIAAAIARFEAETATATEPVPAINPWQRAALVEGVSAKEAGRDLDDLEGGARWLS